MATMQLPSTLEQHRLRVPLAVIMFGKPVEITCELQFDYDPHFKAYTFKHCRGYFEGHLIDFAFLTHSSDFAKMVNGNKQEWNKDYEWWKTAKPVEETPDDFDPEPFDDGPRYA